MKTQTQKCKKLLYKISENDNNPNIIFGLIISEDDNFITFKTARREYKISKSCIVTIEDTDKIFVEENKGGVEE